MLLGASMTEKHKNKYSVQMAGLNLKYHIYRKNKKSSKTLLHHVKC